MPKALISDLKEQSEYPPPFIAEIKSLLEYI